MKKSHLVLGLLIAAVALYFTFRNADFQRIYTAIVSVKLPFLVLSAVLFLFSFVVRGYRWHFLCRSVKPIPTGRLFSPLMIGFMGNLLPARAGEFIRAYLLGKREDIGFSSSFATVVVERIFDMFSILVLFVGMLLLDPEVFVPQAGGEASELAEGIRVFGLMSLVGVIGLVVFCYFLVHQQERALSFVRFFTRVLPHRFRGKIEEILGAFTEGLGILKDARGLIFSVVLSAVLWGIIVGLQYPLYCAFGIESALPLRSLVTLLVVTCVLISVMPTPGYVGSFQLAMTFVLGDLYGIDPSVAEGFSVVSWFMQMGLVFLVGIFFLLRDNIRFFELTRAAQEMAETAEE